GCDQDCLGATEVPVQPGHLRIANEIRQRGIGGADEVVLVALLNRAYAENREQQRCDGQAQYASNDVLQHVSLHSGSFLVTGRRCAARALNPVPRPRGTPAGYLAYTSPIPGVRRTAHRPCRNIRPAALSRSE